MQLKNLAVSWALRGTRALRRQLLKEMRETENVATVWRQQLLQSLQNKPKANPYMVEQLVVNLEDSIPDAFRWVMVGKETALYSRCNAAGRPYQIWQHKLNSAPTHDELLFEEKNKSCTLDVALTRDQQYVTINSNTRTSSEVHVLETSCLTAPPTLLSPREPLLEYYVDHAHGQFYIFTNLGTDREYKLMVAEDSSPEVWKEFYYPEQELLLHDMELYWDCIVLYGSRKLVPVAVVIDVRDIDNKEPVVLHVEDACQFERQYIQDFNSSSVSFTLSSPVSLPRLFVYEDKEVSEVSVGESNREDYVIERVEAPSKDGTAVPMTLCYNGRLVNNDGNPTLVQVYGCYGESLYQGHQSELACLVDRGWILASCHVRGGGELGRRWYYGGRGRNKSHTFEDLYGCVDFLHRHGYSHPLLTALHGRSAGAMAVAAFCNLWPSTVQAAILQVPFVDVIGSLSNSSLYLTAKDLEEFGDPFSSQSELDHVISICPYSNLKPQGYPAMLIMASKMDELVSFQGVQKYVDRLRECNGLYLRESRGDGGMEKSGGQKSRGAVLFSIDEKTGHYGSAVMEERWKEATVQYAFLHKVLRL